MKVIIIYSGKGGVGKTTTTANIAKVLASQKQKVFVLDVDVNTPSMNNVFPESDPNEYLHIESLGYETKRLIYIQQSMIRSYIRTCISKITEYKPEYVLIDTPPSITDVHINLIESMKVSGIVMVTQPNPMSRQDVMRTHLFFDSKDVQTIGIVENMVEVVTEIEYPWPILGRIKFVPGFDFNEVFKQNEETYKQIAESLKNLESVILENKKRAYTDESITVDDMVDLYGAEYGDRFPSKHIPKFVNLATWEFVRERLEDLQWGMGQADRFLDENNTERIGRLLGAFDEDDQAYFMITKAPCCEIKTFPGEIGQAVLDLSKESYYGVPRIKYHTSKGDITLFPHEVLPVGRDEMELCLLEGGVISKDGRYIPSKATLAEVAYCFGDRVGMTDGWEKDYEELFAV